MKQALRKFCIAAAGFTLLAACGGGSDDGGGLTGDIPPSEPATITAQNAPLIAGTVAEVAMGQGIFSSIVTPDIPIAATTGDAVSPVLKPVLTAAMKTAAPSQLFSMKAGREPCAISGTVDVTVNFSNPEQPSVNDRFEFLFTDCDDGTGVIVDGSMTITIASIGGDVASGNFVLGMEIGFFAFAVTEGGETTSAEGAISIVIDTSQPPVTTISVSTTTFVTTSEGEEAILTSFTIEITEDASMFPASVTVETSFTISSPRIGGEVTVTTSLALQSMGEDYPFVGELRIEGANQAVIVMIALDANTVRLQIDVDGDGATDETIDTTWDELMAAAG
jgi:uncharacterized protein YhfF